MNTPTESHPRLIATVLFAVLIANGAHGETHLTFEQAMKVAFPRSAHVEADSRNAQRGAEEGSLEAGAANRCARRAFGRYLRRGHPRRA